MKKLIYILPLLLLPCMTIAQEQAAEPIKKEVKSYKNQIDLDVELLGVGLVFKHKLSNKYFIGGGFAGGVITSLSKGGLFFEFLRYNLFLGYQNTPKTYCYIGLKYSPGAISIEIDDNVNISGLEYGIFHKVSRVELGIKFSLISYKELDGREVYKAITTSLLVLRVPLF